MSGRKNSFDMRDRSNSKESIILIPGRNNSFDMRDRSNSKESRSWSFGSIESIEMNDDIIVDNENKSRRRPREKNIDDRRKSPNPKYWTLLMLEFLKTQSK